ncbi:MAG: sugar transferase [Actinobacteria bacterium]|nr:sugar transferase [Actinomycetota bacterium]
MSRRWWTVLNVVTDAVMLNVAVVLAFLLRFGWPIPAFNFEAYLTAALPITVGQVLILALVDLYVPTADRSGPELLWTVSKGVVLGGLVLVAFTFFLRAFAFPRVVILLALVIQVLLLWGWRVLAAEGLRVRWPARRILMVGDPSDCREITHRIDGMKRWGYRVVGVLEQGACLPEQLDALRPDQIIFATPSRHREALEQVALSRSFEGDIYVVPQLYEMHLGEVNFALLGDIPLIRLSRASHPNWKHGFKSWVERGFAALVLLVGALPAGLIALAILVTSGSPVIYRQTRVGRDFEPFTLFKFRTMVRDAEQAGAVLAADDDPRVTGVGRWLRRSRLDELPQLYNVLRGDMSFVGPRPERPEFVEDFMCTHPLYRERFRVRPGITGLAQVSASYATSPGAKLRFDLMYLYHESLSLDLRIVLQTLKVILTGRGAR